MYVYIFSEKSRNDNLRITEQIYLPCSKVTFMKILFLTDRYPPLYKGGYELRCSDVAERLSHRGHEVSILTTTYGLNQGKIEGNVFRLLGYCGWEMINSHKNFLIAQLKRAFLTRKNYWITRKIIKETTPDIVYVSQLSNASILPVLAVHKHGIPYVFDIEDYWLMESKDYYNTKNRFFRRILRYLLTGVWHLTELNCDNLCFISNHVKQKYIAAGFRDVNFRVINKGVDPSPQDELRQLNKDLKCVHLLYAGRLSEEKGVHIVIEALMHVVARLKDRAITLDIIGSGEEAYSEKLKKLTRTLHGEGVVRFTGQCSQSDLFQRFKNYDIVLLPSLWEEPSGGIIVEAMAHGLPVIASNIGGIPEFINNGVTGMLVSPGSAREMAEAIEGLIKNASLYEQMSTSGMREVQKKYSHEKIIGQIDDYLHTVVTRAQ